MWIYVKRASKPSDPTCKGLMCTASSKSSALSTTLRLPLGSSPPVGSQFVYILSDFKFEM